MRCWCRRWFVRAGTAQKNCKINGLWKKNIFETFEKFYSFIPFPLAYDQRTSGITINLTQCEHYQKKMSVKIILWELNSIYFYWRALSLRIVWDFLLDLSVLRGFLWLSMVMFCWGSFSSWGMPGGGRFLVRSKRISEWKWLCKSVKLVVQEN